MNALSVEAAVLRARVGVVADHLRAGALARVERGDESVVILRDDGFDAASGGARDDQGRAGRSRIS